jgi:hypothetical protein
VDSTGLFRLLHAAANTSTQQTATPFADETAAAADATTEDATTTGTYRFTEHDPDSATETHCCRR